MKEISLEEKRNLIENDVKDLLTNMKIKPIVWSFGAIEINPKHLVVVVGVQTNAEKEKLKSDPIFNSHLCNLLIKNNWPEKSIKYVSFDIESEETVKNESNGNWWYHYK